MGVAEDRNMGCSAGICWQAFSVVKLLNESFNSTKPGGRSTLQALVDRPEVNHLFSIPSD